MNPIARLWTTGMLGKAIVGLVALLLSCCALGAVGSLVGPRTTPNPTPESIAFSATQPTTSPATSATVTAAPNVEETEISPTATLAPTPTAIPTAIALPTATAPALGALTAPQDLPTAQVVRVVDGDTVDIQLDGETARVRLIGIDTPEVVDPRGPVECFGREASAKAHELLDGQTVAVEADSSQGDRDKYDRLLRYLWLPDGRLVNQELLAQGYAFEYTYSLPYAYQAQFQQAQQEARTAQRGLWSPQACDGEHRPAEVAPTSAPARPKPAATSRPRPAATSRPRPTTTPRARPTATPRPRTTAAPALAASCDPAYPDVCIPPPPPDLDCADVPYRRFRVLAPDPHRFDRDRDGIGCE